MAVVGSTDDAQSLSKTLLGCFTHTVALQAPGAGKRQQLWGQLLLRGGGGAEEDEAVKVSASKTGHGSGARPDEDEDLKRLAAHNRVAAAAAL